MRDWQTRFETEFIKKSGEHLLSLGITGGGKTQFLYWILHGLLKKTNETIIWNDSGKSSELLIVMQLAPVNIIMPNDESLGIDINATFNADVTYSYFSSPREVWNCIDRKRINVLMIEPYIRRPKQFTEVITKIFSELIDMAHDYYLPTPMTIFYDEFHTVAPAKGHAFDSKHSEFGAEIQYNIERLRSLRVRIIASSQNWNKMRKGVRSTFTWFGINRGANFNSDEQPKLSRFNKKFEKLQTEQSLICFPDKVFTDIITMPFYGDGEDYGTIRYKGKIQSKEEKEQEQKATII